MIGQPRLRNESWAAQTWRLLMRIVLGVLVVYVAYRLRHVATIIALSVVLALALQPLVERFVNLIPLHRMSRHGRRIFGALAVFVVLIALLVMACLILFHPFQVELSGVTSDYVRNFDGYAAQVTNWYNGLPKDMQDLIRKQDLSSVARGSGVMLGNLVKGAFNWLSLGWELILIPVLAFYFVVDYRTLKREFAFLVPRERTREALLLLHEVGQITQSYVLGQLILCLIAGLVVWIGLLCLGVKYALTLGVLAGITRAIPIVGPVIGGIPIVLMAMVQSWETGAWVLVFFAILHLIESKLIMPKLIGYRMHLHAAVVIIVLLIGAEFFGVLGMFLAAPVAAIIKVLINFYLIRPKASKRFEPSLDGAEQLVGAGKEILP